MLLLAASHAAPSSAAGSHAHVAASLSSARGDARVERLLSDIASAKGPTKANLIDGLAALKSREAFDALVDVTSSLRNPDIQRMAMESFDHFKGVDGLESRAIDWLSKECSSGREPVRRGAARGLARFGNAASSELSSLVSRSKDPRVRAFAVGGLLPELVAEGSPGALETLVMNADFGPTGTREELARALELFQGSSNTAALASTLRAKALDPGMKVLVCESLATRQEDGVAKALQVALKDKAPEVRLAAMRALDTQGETAHAGKLRKQVKDPSEVVRRESVIMLGRIHAADEAWITEVTDYSNHKDPAVRMGAAVALAELRTEAALAELYRMLADADHLVQREALQQVGNLRRKETLPALIGRINGARGRMRVELLTVLRLITGEDHGSSYERWKRWWDAEGAAFEVPPYNKAYLAERERERRRKSGDTVSTFYGLQVVSERVCFIMDISGSMEEQSGGQRRIDAAKEQLLGALEGYPDKALFNVIFFASDAFSWSDELVKMGKKTREEALEYVTRQKPGGGTAVFDALELAFEDRRIDTIYLLTDGDPSAGRITDPGRIREEVKRWNTTRHVEVHGIAVGKESPLLKNLAADSGGEYRMVR